MSMEVDFVQRISFPLNFWIHLETACGSPSVYYSPSYENEVSFQIREIRTKFLEIHEGYNFSLEIRRIASNCKTVEELANSLVEYNISWRKIIAQNSETYKLYWDSLFLHEVKSFSDVIKNNANILNNVVLEIPKITGIRSLPRNIKIYPIHSLSEKYGFGAQPIFPDGVLLGIINEEFLLLALTHEIIHLNTYDVFRNLVSHKKRKFEKDVIDEALVNLTLNVMIEKNLLHQPVLDIIPGVETPEFKEFQRRFEELNSQILPLTKGILEKGKTILDMKVEIEKITSK